MQLFYIFYYRSGFKYEIIKNPFNKNSGIFYSLSPEVIESNNFLKKHKAIDFNLSGVLKKDTYLYQRSIEFNYPIKINEASEFIFFYRDEDIPNSCRVLETGKYLKLTQC
tara:strand:- start:393 stop:722 length:330 start_codon:yes stop_codon:yes gene_type:complete